LADLWLLLIAVVAVVAACLLARDCSRARLIFLHTKQFEFAAQAQRSLKECAAAVVIAVAIGGRLLLLLLMLLQQNCSELCCTFENLQFQITM